MLSGVTQWFPYLDFIVDENGELVTQRGLQAIVYQVRFKNPTGSANEGNARTYALRMDAPINPGDNPAHLHWTAHCSKLFCGAPFVETMHAHCKLICMPTGYQYASLMPWYQTTIFHYASSTMSSPSEETIRSIVAQVLHALVVMHERGYAHRDLSGANIMLDNANTQIPRVHVGDFGFTTFYDPSDAAKVPSDLSVGTMPYQSPESLLGCPHCDPFKGDIWALGVNMYHLMTKQLTWLEENAPTLEEDKENKRLYQIKHTFTDFAPFHCQAWNDEEADSNYCAVADKTIFAPFSIDHLNFSDDAKDVLHRLLQPIPSNRPTAGDALNHQWFRSEPYLFNFNSQSTPTLTKSSASEGSL